MNSALLYLAKGTADDLDIGQRFERRKICALPDVLIWIELIRNDWRCEVAYPIDLLLWSESSTQLSQVEPLK